MKYTFSTGGGGDKPLTSWLLALAATGLMVGAGPAFAAAPGAGTEIGNQATASYVDSNSATQVATSNKVITKVQQVGSLTLVSDNNVKVAPGGTVYASHILTNTGNGADSFTLSVTSSNPDVTPEIYADANGDGLPEGKLTGDQALAAGGKLQFLVAYKAPGSASIPWQVKGTVKADAKTPALYATSSATNTCMRLNFNFLRFMICCLVWQAFFFSQWGALLEG